MVTNGVSTRKVERAAAQMGIDRISSSQVSRICETLDDAEADASTYLDFLYARHRRLRASSMQERANRELKRRSRAAHAFPSRRSPIRMMGALFSGVDEGWATRRWFTEVSIAQAAPPSEWLRRRHPTTEPPRDMPSASSTSWSPTTRSERELPR